MPRLPRILLLLLVSSGCGDSPADGPDGGPVGMPLSCGEEPCTYVISALRPPRMDEEGRVIGVDLDGHASDETAERSCGHADFVAPDGTMGVDNEFVRLVPTFEETLGISLDESANAGIQRGDFLFGIALTGVDSTEDPSVQVEAGSLQLPVDTELPSTGADGLSPDQSFSWAEPPTAGDGAIEASVLDVPLGDLTIQWDFDETTELTFPIRDGRIRTTFSDGEPSGGLLVGRIAIDDLLAMVIITDDPDPDLLRRTLEDVADLDPDSEGVCQSISIAVEVELVRAQIEP